MALVTIKPDWVTGLLIAQQIATMIYEKETKGITRKALIEEYIPKQQARQKRLKKQRDNA